MYETSDDLAALQRLLDESYATAGAHLRSIITPQRRAAAVELPELLPGVQQLHLATVSASGEPLVAPVDGLLCRGRLWFGSSPDSVRCRHIAARPAISGSIAHGERFGLAVHGTAIRVDLDDPACADFNRYAADVYGDWWHDWAREQVYWRIRPRRMFTFHNPEGTGPS